MDADFTSLCPVFKSLSSRKRMDIVSVLAKGSRTLGDVVLFLGGNDYPDAIYRHLEILVAAGLVTKKYDNGRKRVMYSLVDTRIEAREGALVMSFMSMMEAASLETIE